MTKVKYEDERETECEGATKRSSAKLKSAKASKTKRWLTILSKLNGAWMEDHDRLSTRDIHSAVCAELQIPDSNNSLRNTQRDLEEIEVSGIVRLQKTVELSHGTGRQPPERITYWRLVDTPLNLDKLNLAKSPDALILLLASRHLKHLLPPDMALRLEDLANLSERFLEKRTTTTWAKPWQSKLRIDPRGHALEKPSIPPGILAAIYDALANHKRIRLRYFRPGQPPRDGEYDPLGLVYRDPLTYLVAQFADRGTPHTLALHRIESAEVLLEDSRASRDFDLDDFVREDRNTRVYAHDVRIRVRVTPGMFDHWRLARLGKDQVEKRDPDGGGTISATVNDTDELRRYLLGLGSQVQILEPDSIRSWIWGQARHLVEGMSPTPNRSSPKKVE